MVTKSDAASPAAAYQVSCATENALGLEISVFRIARERVTFQVYTPGAVLRVSQHLKDFRIIRSGEVLYNGRATLTSVVDTGTSLNCEAKLEEAWLDFNPASSGDPTSTRSLTHLLAATLANRFITEFKVAVADMQMLLWDLQHWTEQITWHVMAEPSSSRKTLERKLVEQMCEEAFPLLAGVFERFEGACGLVDADQAPAYAFYVKRQLHPIVLCAPFMYRTYRKPLGYAGDYEMVSMMLRDPFEGGSPFAKLLNAFFLNTPPVKAHQNRITELKRMLTSELIRGKSLPRRFRILNIGCGPAKELQDLIAATDLVNSVDFTLIDFNQETLDYAARALSECIRSAGRTTQINLVRRSVAQLLKEAVRSQQGITANSFDVVYCAGLFDYLPQAVCQQLLVLGHNLLAPSGLLLATNVDDYNPSRHWMELAVDWHLIYRNAREMEALMPQDSDPEGRRIYSEPSGVNIFLEARKPSNG